MSFAAATVQGPHIDWAALSPLIALTAGACLVWFPVTEGLDSGLRSSVAKAGRSTPVCLGWASGGAGFAAAAAASAATAGSMGRSLTGRDGDSRLTHT